MSRLAVGQAWPQGDEDGLRAVAGVWADAAVRLGNVSNALGPLGSGMSDALSGAAGDQFQSFVSSLGKMTPQVAEASVQVAGSARNAAVQTQYAKLMILLQLVWMAEQILEWASTLWGAAVAAEVVALGRLLVAQIAKRLVVSVVSGAVMQVGMDAVVQAFQMFVLKDRTTWDKRSTVGALEMGALGGAVGGVLHEVGSAIAPKFMTGVAGRLGLAGATGVVTAELSGVAFGGQQDVALALTVGGRGGFVRGAGAWCGGG